jgi:hypothetical protein
MLEPNGGWRVKLCRISVAPYAPFPKCIPNPRQIMIITAAELSPIVALIAGILILIIPRLLNIIVAVYLIIEGLVGLNAVHHFIH